MNGQNYRPAAAIRRGVMAGFADAGLALAARAAAAARAIAVAAIALGLAPAAYAQTYPEDFTVATANFIPESIWVEDDYVWIVSSANDHIWAFDRRTGTRAGGQDIPLDKTLNTDPAGIWARHDNMWVADSGDNKVYVYRRSDGMLLSAFEQPFATENQHAHGIWSDGATIWVADHDDNHIYAYQLASRNRRMNMEIPLAAANTDARGIWSDGTTMWVADAVDDIAYAYNLADRTYDSAKNIPASEIGTAGTLVGIAGDTDGVNDDLILTVSQDGNNDRVRGIRHSTLKRFQPGVAVNIWDYGGVTEAEEQEAQAFEVRVATAPASDVDIPVVVTQQGNWLPADRLRTHTVTIKAGETAGTLRFDAALYEDNTDEPDGSITLTLGALPASYDPGVATYTIIMLDNDSPPQLAYQTNNHTASEHAGHMAFPIGIAPRDLQGDPQIGALTEYTMTVNYQTNTGGPGQNAVEGEDFTAVSGTLTWAPDETDLVHTVLVPIMPDADDTADIFEITLTMFVNVRDHLGGTEGGIVLIGEILERPSVTLLDDHLFAIQEGEDAVFRLILAPAQTTNFTATVAVRQAPPPEFPDETRDIVAAQHLGERPIVIPAGRTETRFTVPTVNDNTYELQGRVRATISAAPAGYDISIGSQDVAVESDDDEPVISVADSGGTEGGEAVFIVTLSPREEPLPGEVVGNGNVSDATSTVNWATSAEEGDTAEAGEDFAAVSGTLTFAPGRTEARITVDLPQADDDLDVETFTLTLSVDPDDFHATFAQPDELGKGRTDPISVVGTVFETAELSIAAADADGMVFEHEAAVFIVSVNRAQEAPLVVPATVEQTAGAVLAAGQPRRTTAVIPAGRLSARLTVELDDDARDEENGAIRATIALPAGQFVITTDTAALRVLDNDGPPTATVEATAPALEGERLEFVIRLAGDSDFTVTVAFDASDNTATAGEDYVSVSGTLTFGPDEQRVARVFVPTIRDEIREDDETMALRLLPQAAGPNTARLSQAQAAAVGVITENINARHAAELNAAIAPHLAATISGRLSAITRGRVAEGFADERNYRLTVDGVGLLEYLAAGNKHLWGEATPPAEINRGRDAAPRSHGANDIHLPTPDRLAYRPAADTAATAGGEPAFTLWARRYADKLNFATERLDINGDINGGMAGLDTLIGDALVGIGFNQVETDMRVHRYIFANGGQFNGFHRVSLRGIHPYFGVRTSGGGHVWGGVGLDRGESELIQYDDPEAEPGWVYDVAMHSVRFGGHGPVFVGPANEVALVGDVAMARVFEAVEDVDGDDAAAPPGFEAKSGRARLGIKSDAVGVLAHGFAVSRAIEMVLRHDFGDGLVGTGVEVGGRFGYDLPRAGLSAAISARALAFHADEVEDWGLSADFNWAARSDGRGPSVAFKPQWGETQSAAQTLWRHGATARPAADNTPARYGVTVKYGLSLTDEQALLTLSAHGDWAGLDRDTRWGADYQLGDHFTAGYTATIHPNMDRRGHIRYHWRF